MIGDHRTIVGINLYVRIEENTRFIEILVIGDQSVLKRRTGFIERQKKMGPMH